MRSRRRPVARRRGGLPDANASIGMNCPPDAMPKLALASRGPHHAARPSPAATGRRGVISPCEELLVAIRRDHQLQKPRPRHRVLAVRRDVHEPEPHVQSLRRGHRGQRIETYAPVARRSRVADQPAHELFADAKRTELLAHEQPLHLAAVGRLERLERDAPRRPPLHSRQQQRTGGRRIWPGQLGELGVERLLLEIPCEFLLPTRQVNILPKERANGIDIGRSLGPPNDCRTQGALPAPNRTESSTARTRMAVAVRAVNRLSCSRMGTIV